jgi:RNA polymerase sigma-70 factor (ECF subfamily)
MSYLRSRPDLLGRFRAGERDALAEVYRAYLPQVQQCLRRGFTIRATGMRVPGLSNRDDLADTLQEVFERAFKREARLAYDGLRDYAPYLLVIARNAIVSRYRKQGRELLGVDTAVLADGSVDVNAAEEEAPWFESRSIEITRAYVTTLEEPMRGVHQARYVQSLSQRDAAKELGLSRPKVRKLETKLRRELLSLLLRAGLRLDDDGDQPQRSGDGKGPWTQRPRVS